MGTCRCTTTGMSPTVSKNLQQWHLHKLLRSQDHGQLSLQNNGHVNNLAQDLQQWSLQGVPAQSGPWATHIA